MDFTQIIILGLVQGVTEFLPISSTAHLILLPWFFKFPDPGLTFDIALHLGTLLAILIYFWREWWQIIRRGAEVAHGNFDSASNSLAKNHALLNESHRRSQGETSQNLWAPRAFSLLFIATLPGLVFGFLFESWAETLFRNPIIIAISLALFGLILWFADKKFTHQKSLEDLDLKKAFFIGLGQALAIIPGVSRSGGSITAGLLIGLKREAAVKFSFLLSAPIILGSTIMGIFKVSSIKYQVSSIELFLGVLTSFFAGILTIKFLLKFVQKRSFLPFVIYRIVLAIIILLAYFI